MKDKILGLRTAIYKVGDINAAKKWYAQAFETEPYFVEPFYVGFDIGGYELGLLPEEKFEKEKAENILTYWGVNDIDTEFKKFKSLGAIEYENPKDVGDGVIVAALKDPWGNIIGLIYNPYFKITS